MSVEKAINFAVGPLDDHCLGYNLRGNYFLAFHVAATAVPARFSLEGSPRLDAVCAFDEAEVDGAYLGQLNVITVSSFCGPHGLIWGYHVARSPELRGERLFSRTSGGREIPVYSAEPLLAAGRALFGTRERKRFPILPGSHTPAAMMTHTQAGPGAIGAAFGLGIVGDRRGAHILMEDVCPLPESEVGGRSLVRRVAEGVLVVAEAQRLAVSEIFVGVRTAEIKAGQYGCALALLPYFKLARRALPGGSAERLAAISLPDWEKSSLWE